MRDRKGSLLLASLEKRRTRFAHTKLPHVIDGGVALDSNKQSNAERKTYFHQRFSPDSSL
jgi:hypothetical protein